jgi:starvation-inducible DNA-binding protein
MEVVMKKTHSSKPTTFQDKDPFVSVLHKAEEELELSAEELQRMEDEGGSTLNTEQKKEAETYLKARKHLQKVLPVFEERLTPKENKEDNMKTLYKNPLNINYLNEDDAISAYNKEEYGELVGAMSRFLASTYVLYHKTLYYHWNVVGSHFFSLHKLFEQHYVDLQEAGDLIAERIRAMGYTSPGRLCEFLEMASLTEDDILPSSDMEMIVSLIKDHKTCAEEAKAVLDMADDVSDAVSSDIMMQRIKFHEKAIWMLEALKA